MSAKLILYQDVKAALQAISEIKNVLHYNGQDLTNFEKDVSLQFPQVWVQLTSITWKPSELKAYNQNKTQQQKSDQAFITIYSATYSLRNDNDTFENDLLLVDKIYRALANLDGDCYGPLQRLNEEDQPTNNNVRVWAQTYSTMLTEAPISEGLVDVSPVELTINKIIIP